MPDAKQRLVLRDLPVAPRLVIAVFMFSVGLGYLAALAQLHLQHAEPGAWLPGGQQIEDKYHGPTELPMSRIEKLLESTTGGFNGFGTMRPAFTEKSERWDDLRQGKTSEQLDLLESEREGERLGLLHWVRAGANKRAYDDDDLPLGEDFAHAHVTPMLLIWDAKTGPMVQPRRLRIRTLITMRCVPCHNENGLYEAASAFPLDTYARVQPYCQPPPPQTSIALPKLAQTTHAHWLSFAMLWSATGLVYSFTRFSGGWRALVAPLPLIAQMLNIACWWLARWHPLFAWAILGTGILVGIGLCLQIMGILWDLFDGIGRCITIVILVFVLVGVGWTARSIVRPFLEQERLQAMQQPQ